MDKDKEDVTVVEQTTIKATPNRDKLLRGLRKRGVDLPDDADTETIIGAAMPRYKDLEGKNRAMEENNALIMDAIASNPDVGEMLNELLGVDKEGNSKFVSEVKKRAERMANDQKAQEEWEANLTKSLEGMEEAFTELEATEDEREAVRVFVNNVLSGNISKQMIVDYVQGVRHDDDVDAAGIAGEVKGRNAVIDKNKLDLREKDDLPIPKNSGNTIKKEEDFADERLFGNRLNPAKYAQKVS